LVVAERFTIQYDVVCAESLNMRAMSNRGSGNGINVVAKSQE
jgi:hypothetical protein